MEMIETVVKTPKEATELGLALGELVLAGHKAFKDGFQMEDVTKLLSVIMSEKVMAGIKGLDQLSTELKADKTAFVASFVIAAVKVAEGLEAPVQA